jgi:probable aminopeptidase NPEPL1
VADFSFARTLPTAIKTENLVFVGTQRALKTLPGKLYPKAPWLKLVKSMAAESEAGPLGKTVSTYTGGKAPKKVTLAVLPDTVSRHLSPSRSHAVEVQAARCGLGSGTHTVVLCLDDAAHYVPVANAVARVVPLYWRKGTKTGAKKTPAKKHSVQFVAVDKKGGFVAASSTVSSTVHNTRWSASLVDTPTAEMTTADFVSAARKQARKLSGVKVSVIVGDKLLDKKLGGIHAVGRTAMVAPRLLVMEYNPRGAKQRVALVGKGVVYDTGGLSLKTGGHMAGMKADMGGAAAVAGAFFALVQQKVSTRVVCLAPLAENAIGPNSYRPDDILDMHSGKTVEINNTDAEGRLLLADGVSYAARTFKPDLVIDAATLTGAQLLSTGKRHAAVVSNRERVEALAVASGRRSGDLTHALPFAPELFQREFDSEVADMKNSVKDRMNAQCSCAGQFVYGHMSDTNLPWLHIDLAGPAMPGRRATGFGVALMGEIVRGLKASDLKK